jgi:serine/threonine protein kinase
MAERDPLNLVGSTIAEKYRIERMVGEGGFAVVYRAEHTIWNKPVALKFFSALSNVPVEQRETMQQAFIQEGALLTDLSSQTAGIVQARDVGSLTTPNGQWVPYMVLEWLEGYPLDQLIERERSAGLPCWSVTEVARLLVQVSSALDVAHGKGIAHRDIKPANLFVLGPNPGRTSSVKILDFGVAKMMSENTELKAALAKTGMSVTSFTPQYGAPEQFSRSYGATGPWTDVFALALVGVELLAGRPALDGDDLVQLGFATGNPARRPTPRGLGVGVPDSVEQVFKTALAVRPEDRYARARDFANALNAALGASDVTVMAPSPVSRLSAPTVGAPSFGAPTELAPASALPAGGMSTSAPSTVTTQGAAERPKNRVGLALALGAGALALGAGAFFFLGGKGSSRSACRKQPPRRQPPPRLPPPSRRRRSRPAPSAWSRSRRGSSSRARTRRTRATTRSPRTT